MAFYEKHHIPIEPTDMSFAIAMPRLSWAFGSGLRNLANLLVTPKFWTFVMDKSQFHQDARAFLASCDEDSPRAITVRQFCKEKGYRPAFVEGWLIPFCEAVWSADTQSAEDMEAFTVFAFLRNHAFLSWSSVQWFTPKGRTTVTLNRFQALFKQFNVIVHTDAAVSGIERRPDASVAVTLAQSSTIQVFDDVVIATPAGVALTLIQQPTDDDERCLAGFRSSQTQLVVHQDTSLMPK